VVIVGAGITGLTLACCLIRKGLRLAIIDKHEIRMLADKLSGNTAENSSAQSLRVSAITMGSQQLLEQLHVWQSLAKTMLAPFQGVEVWEQASASRLFFNAADTCQPHLGTIVKNLDLQAACILQAKQAAELDWFSAESVVAAIQKQRTLTVLSLASGASISTRLLVGADGAQSCVRQLAGIQSTARDYQQQAIVATVQTVLTHGQTARQIFLPTGPLAFLPLGDPHLSSIVWTTTLAEAEKLKALSNTLFCLALASAFEYRLGQVEAVSTRLSFPLQAQYCEHYIKPGIALIGDAAHTIHPLAGQGANLGIADALCLAKMILEAKQKQRNIGGIPTLRRYERERRFQNRLMSSGVDFIKYAWATPHPLWQGVRAFGIRALDKTAWIKNPLVHYAMGKPSVSPLKSMV